MDALPRRTLGTTGINLPVLACGDTGWADDDADAPALVREALTLGIDYFDTAPFYGLGRSEARLGAVLGQIDRPGLIVSTKIGRCIDAAADAPSLQPLPGRDGGFDYGHDAVMRSVEASLRRLGRSQVDLLFVHDLSLRWHGDDLPRRTAEALGGALPALRRLRE